MRLSLIVLLLTCSLAASAQINEIRYYNNNDEETTVDSAEYFTKFTWKSEAKTACSIQDYLLKDSTPIYEAEYSNFDSSVHVGISKLYNRKTGKLFKEFFYDDVGFNKTFKQYYPNGNIKRIDNYVQGKETTGILKSPDGKVVPYEPYEVMPSFTGGLDKLMEYLGSNIKYPRKARRKGIEGEVQVDFTVCTDGSLCDFEVRQSVSEEIDAEVIKNIESNAKMDTRQTGWQGRKSKIYFTRSFYAGTRKRRLVINID